MARPIRSTPKPEPTSTPKGEEPRPDPREILRDPSQWSPAAWKAWGHSVKQGSSNRADPGPSKPS